MTAIYLAGGEVETLTRALLDNGAKNVLYSYYYILTMNRASFIDKMQDQYPDVEWFLDSGAFTYAMAVKDESRAKRLPKYREYVKQYMEYIGTYGHRFCRVTEPDLDVAGEQLDLETEEVDEWRETMLEMWPDLPITAVYHGWRGRDAWDRYCVDKRLHHLAIGRGTYVGQGVTIGLYSRLINQAHQHGKTVHGFAMTKLSYLRYNHFDTVDSTSWVMGQKYGTLYVFSGDRFVVLSKQNGGKAKRRQYKRYLERIGCDPDKVFGDDVEEVRKCNIRSWLFLSGRLVERERQRRLAKMGVGEPKHQAPEEREDVD